VKQLACKVRVSTRLCRVQSQLRVRGNGWFAVPSSFELNSPFCFESRLGFPILPDYRSGDSRARASSAASEPGAFALGWIADCPPSILLSGTTIRSSVGLFCGVRICSRAVRDCAGGSGWLTCPFRSFHWEQWRRILGVLLVEGPAVASAGGSD